MMMDIKKKVLERVIALRDRTKEDLRLINLSINSMEKSTSELRYEVVINSFWFSEGKFDAEVKGTDLPKLLEEVSKKFKEINQRSDIQGKLLVFVWVGGIRIALEDNLFEPIKEATASLGKLVIGYRLKEEDTCNSVRVENERAY